MSEEFRVVPFDAGPHDPETLLPWVHEAGNPYFDWLVGGRETAQEVLRAWMARQSSEVYTARAQILTVDGEALGGFYGIAGADVASCRKADAIALVSADGIHKKDVMFRLSLGRELFTAPVEDEYFLSRLGVLPAAQGRGMGTRLAESFLRVGTGLGFQRFRLDVHEGNLAAIRLYEKHGFHETHRSTTTDGTMTYLSLALET